MTADVYTEPENPCALCHGEGAIGTGYSDSFADVSDAMPCPRCEGVGEEPVYVGCVCNGGKTYVRGIMPAMCGHCHGTGVVTREKYREITAQSSEKEQSWPVSPA